jgi:hypothetical protein
LVQIEQSTVIQTGAEMLERLKFLAAKHGLDVGQVLAGQMPPALIEAQAIRGSQQLIAHTAPEPIEPDDAVADLEL